VPSDYIYEPAAQRSLKEVNMKDIVSGMAVITFLLIHKATNEICICKSGKLCYNEMKRIEQRVK
jgi:hypothetical protein